VFVSILSSFHAAPDLCRPAQGVVLDGCGLHQKAFGGVRVTCIDGFIAFDDLLSNPEEFQIGFGTMIWLITIEVFPTAIRGPAVALSVQTNFAMPW
jgi:Sugar (and other) transporter